MNIGLITPGFSADEDDRAVPALHNLVRTVAASDEVRVLALRYPPRRERYDFYDATVRALGGGQGRGHQRLLLWMRALSLLRRLHREKPFAVLHASWADESGLLAAWAGRWLNIPAVVYVFGGELVGLDDVDYGQQRSRFSRWIIRQALEGADAVVVACDYMRYLIGQAGYRVSDDKIHTIVMGVDEAIFTPADEPPDARRLLHVGALHGVKDQPTLLRALARLDDSVTLDIVGNAPYADYAASLRRLAVELGVAERVTFVGHVDYGAMPAYFQRAALHILPSRHEGLGMVTLEAAACGVPTVGTAVGLLPDHSDLGVSVPVGDDAALADAIGALLDDPARRAALGKSAREAVERRFTVEHAAEQLRALYTRLGG